MTKANRTCEHFDHVQTIIETFDTVQPDNKNQLN